MSDVPAWSTPAAIVIAGALMGLGAYFGLSNSAAPPADLPSTPAVSSTPAARGHSGADGPQLARQLETSSDVGGQLPAPTMGGAAEGEVRSPLGAAEPPGGLEAVVQAEAMKAFEAAKADIIQNCWNPSFARNPEPAQIKLGFSLSFRRSGKMVASGVIEDREAARPDMFECLAAAAHALEIPPQPRDVTVRIDFTLP